MGDGDVGSQKRRRSWTRTSTFDLKPNETSPRSRRNSEKCNQPPDGANSAASQSAAPLGDNSPAARRGSWFKGLPALLAGDTKPPAVEPLGNGSLGSASAKYAEEAVAHDAASSAAERGKTIIDKTETTKTYAKM